MKKLVSLALAVLMLACIFGTCLAEAPAEKEEITVSLWDYSTCDYYKTQIAAFEEAYPQYTVRVIESPSADYGDKIQIMLSGGDTVDVVYIGALATMSGLVVKDQLMPLDDYIAQSDIDPANYSDLISKITMDGKTYGMPFRKDNYMIFYNKDLFDERGVPYPQDGMTLEEFRALAKEMTYGEGADKVYGAHLHTWAKCLWLHPRRIGEFSPYEGSVESLRPYYETYLAMQNEDKSIMDYASLKAGSVHYSGVFYNEQVAMQMMGTWFINMLVEKTADGTIDFEWGVCSLPNDKGEGNTTGVGGITVAAINKNAKNPDGAWAYINYVCGLEGAKVLASSGILPGYTDDEVVGEILKNPGLPENLADYLNLDTIIVEDALDPKAREIDKIFTEEHDLIMTNSVTLDEGLEELQELLDECRAE